MRALGACAVSLVVPGSADAAGARSGSWCVPLTKGARDEAFDFTLKLLEPKEKALYTLSDDLGRPVWLQFFASWCGPCNKEAADVVRVAAKYGDAIRTIGIDVKEPPEKARSFRDAHAIPFPVALDTAGSVYKVFGGRGIPTHVFFDKRGGISCISVGDLTPAQMDNEVAVALARDFPALRGSAPGWTVDRSLARPV